MDLESFKQLDPEEQKKIYLGLKQKQDSFIEKMKWRCMSDVRINTLLYFKEMEYLNKLYNNKTKSILNYIAFKLDCAREQEEIKWKLDVEKVKSNLAYFESEANRRLDALRQIMPKVTKYKSMSKPDKLYKKDGNLTVQATNWFDLLYEQGLEQDHEDPINIIVSEVDGNPKSHTQMKDWLFSLGWIPDYFKKNEKGEDIPQISNAEKQVCNSIKLLYEIEPGLENLESLSVINHRIGVLEGFLENEEDGWVKAEISGFTNTMRFKHSSPCVNLPKAFEESDKRSREYTDGVYIRECLIADEGFQLCGSDMSALEDTTKQHYIFKYDPEYIKEMRTPGYDPHLSLAMLAGMLTEQQVEDHKNGVVSYKNIRFKAKTANFACLPIDNTQVLTKVGWKSYDELSVGEEVFTYNTEKEKLELEPINEIFKYEDAETIYLENHSFKFETTENHRWAGLIPQYSKRKRLGMIKCFRESKKIGCEFLLRTAAVWDNDNTLYTDNECGLLACILADGYLRWSKLPEGTSGSHGTKKGVKCSIAQKKYSNEIRDLLDTFGRVYEEYLRFDGVYIFSLKPDFVRSFFHKFGMYKVDKHNRDYTDVIFNMSNSNRNSFLHYFKLTDGGTKGTTTIFYQNRGNILNGVMLCLTLSGIDYTTSSNGTYKKFESLNVYANNRNHVTGQKLKTRVSRTTDVFCLNTNNSTFVIRQGDRAVITGNSTYKVGYKKLAFTSGMSELEAKALLKTFWERNNAILKTERDTKVKMIDKDMWLYNPVSRLWYSLRYEKDKFSTLNQGEVLCPV